MKSFVTFHPETLHILPLVTIQWGQCENPACGAAHYKLNIGWLVWTVEVDL